MRKTARTPGIVNIGNPVHEYGNALLEELEA